MKYSAEDTQRFWAKVAKSPGCWNWNASKKKGYGCFYFEKRIHSSHRVAFEIANGPIPAGMLIDHICHNRGCVNPNHLRLATTKQNAEHRLGAQGNNHSSGVRGVYWHDRNRMWRGIVTHNQKPILVGYFRTVVEAEAAVVSKRNDLFTYNNADRCMQ